MLAPNTLLQNRYLIVRPIGRGGMGAVYLARDQRLGHTVALKETFFTEERMRKAFEREARLLAHLRHPALPKVTDHFDEDGGQFIVMEFITGDDLEMLLAQRGTPFEVSRVAGWGDELLKALSYLHTQDPPILHRDIKPSNLKLTPQGEIILLDFGLAKGSTGQNSSAMTSRSLFGFTPNFAPLEQIQGTGTGPRSDLYSLAATLYYLMTGVIPPDALTRITEVANGKPDPLVRPDELDSRVPQALADLLMRAMAHNRDQRPANAAEMRRMLREALPAHASIEEYAEEGSARANIEDARTVLPQTLVEAQPTQESPAIAETSPAQTVATPTAHPVAPGPETSPLNELPPPPPAPARNSLRLRWAVGGFVALLILGVSIGLLSNLNSNKSEGGPVVSRDAGASGAIMTPVKQSAVSAPDDSEITTEVDKSGAEVQTRTFRSNQSVYRVVVTTLNGLRTAKVISTGGESRDLPQQFLATALEETGDTLARAVGFFDEKGTNQKESKTTAVTRRPPPVRETAKNNPVKSDPAPERGGPMMSPNELQVTEQNKPNEKTDAARQSTRMPKGGTAQPRALTPQN